jgi:predicted transcriptional regulator
VKIEIAERIIEKRTEKGWNKVKLAKMLGISSAAVGQYEKGNTYPKVEILFKLRDLLNWDFINDKPIVNQQENKSNEDVTKPYPHTIGVLHNSTKFNREANHPYNIDSQNIDSQPLWKIISNQQQQIKLLHEHTDLLYQQVELLNNLLPKS